MIAHGTMFVFALAVNPPGMQERYDMSKSTRNSGKAWTPSEVRQLRQEVRENTPTRVIGLKHGRTEGSIYNKASDEGISLKPTNQSPYGTKGK